jgi:7-cyano-7-deazaguanine synthase in queuosine biosynthesis
MKKYIIAVAVICLFCSSAYAADYCDTKYMELINALKKTDKIFDDQKKKYLPALEKALELCKENKMEEARIIMDEMRDHFFQDALTNESQFFGN